MEWGSTEEALGQVLDQGEVQGRAQGRVQDPWDPVRVLAQDPACGDALGPVQGQDPV